MRKIFDNEKTPNKGDRVKIVQSVHEFASSDDLGDVYIRDPHGDESLNNNKAFVDVRLGAIKNIDISGEYPKVFFNVEYDDEVYEIKHTDLFEQEEDAYEAFMRDYETNPM